MKEGISFKMLKRLVDHRKDTSLATRLRRNRFALFRQLVSSLEQPVTILDVGGTPRFWQMMCFDGGRSARIVILNLKEPDLVPPNITFVLGDATDLGRYEDKAFDVVFSNSVIEHLGAYAAQRRMAEEVKRVGKRYFVQTPNRYFPIEPHVLVPLFQFFPTPLKVFLVRRFNLGWVSRRPNKQEAEALVDSIKLLTERDVRTLFPEATIHKEKFLGLTKSFIACGGWSQGADA
jgi:hypothetical protein